jgi:lysophospholipase-2
MAASRVVIWLHGLGDSGPANESLASFFTAPQLRNFKWLFPSAPYQPVSCNGGAVMPSWFDLSEIPVVAESPNVDDSVIKAVQSVHQMIDKEVAAGVSADNIFLCGFSQGGALTLASYMLYPKTLAGAAVFSGWVPLDPPGFVEKITAEAKKTPVLWLHGIDDQVVKFCAGKAGPPVLARANVTCDFKAIPGLGHSINPEELSILQQWMKEKL